MDNSGSEWAKDLKLRLAEAADLYRECLASHNDRPGAYKLRDRIASDAEPIDIARVYILKSLGAVMEELLKLPEFRDTDGLIMQPLHDLAQALLGLNEGRRSELLETRKVMVRKQHPVEAQRQALAVALVEFFEQAGLRNVKARNEVARIFGNAGLVGRKGNPISAQTLFEWRNQIDGEDTDGPRRLILAEFRALLSPSDSYAPSLEEATILAHSMTQSMLINSQI